MGTPLSKNEVREIVVSTVTELIKNDLSTHRLIHKIAWDKSAQRDQTEGKIEKILAELKQDREAQTKKWEEQAQKWKEQVKKWDQQEKKWEEQAQKGDKQDKKWEEQAQKWAEQVKKWDQQEKKWEEQVKKWDKQDKKWAEQVKKWDQQEKKWEEQVKKWAEQDNKWAEQVKKWDQQEKKWEEQVKRWDQQEKKWEEQDNKWAENHQAVLSMLAEIKAMNTRHESSIGALGARWGLYTEESFRSGLAAILEKSFQVKVGRYLDYDHEGKVFGRPEQIEMDVIITDGQLILVEIKSAMDKAQLYSFWRKVQFYQEKHQRQANRLIVIAPWVDEKARDAASQMGIEIFSHADEVHERKNRPTKSKQPG